MASDNGLSALAARLDAIADLYSGDLTTCGHAVGKGARIEAKKMAAMATGGSGVLSHMGRKGARLGMGYDVDDRGRKVTMKLRPAGPWTITESGAGAHTIGLGRGRRRQVRYLMAPGYSHPVRGPISHPGTKRSQARRSITRTFGAIRARASEDFHEAYLVKLRGVMGS